MNNNEDISLKDLEAIDRYLAHHMSGNEQQAFERRLASDPQLRVQTEDLRIIRLGIQEYTLRRKLSEFHHNAMADKIPQDQSSVKQLSWRKWVSAAAVILAVIAGAWWVLLKPASEHKLYAKYYQPDPGLMTTMGGAEDYEFNRAMIDYKTGNYDSAISRWQVLHSANVTSDTLSYFLGSAHLGKNEFKRALPLLQQVLIDSGSVFRDDAYWYAGLAALKLKQRALAIQYIRQCTRSGKDKILSELEK